VWVLAIGVMAIVAATVTVPKMAQATIDGSQLYTLDASLVTQNFKDANYLTISNFTGTFKLVNPMPIGGTVEKATAHLSIDEYFSKMYPDDLGYMELPEVQSGPGKTIFEVNTQLHGYLGPNDGWDSAAWAAGVMQGKSQFVDCKGCVKTANKERPVPQTMKADVVLRVGMLKSKVTMEKRNICHCMTGAKHKIVAPEGLNCNPLDEYLPYSSKYTPCFNKSGCPWWSVTGTTTTVTVTTTTLDPKPQVQAMQGFHCAPDSTVIF